MVLSPAHLQQQITVSLHVQIQGLFTVCVSEVTSKNFNIIIIYNNNKIPVRGKVLREVKALRFPTIMWIELKTLNH